MSEQSTATAAASPPPSDKPMFAATQLVSGWKYESPLIACRCDPTGRFAVSSAQDNTIQKWDLATGQATVLAGHDSWLRGLGFSPDGQTLYSAGYDGLLLRWDFAADQPSVSQQISAHDGWVRWLEVSPDGAWLATCGNDRLVKVWNTSDGSLAHTLARHEAHVYSTLFHPREPILLSGDLLGQIHQWDLSTGQCMRSLKADDLHTYNGGQGAHYGGIRSMALSPDGQRLACSGLHKATNPFGAVQEPLVVVFSWDSGEASASLVAENIDRGIVWRACYHPSGTLIGSSGGGSGGFLLFWHDATEKTVHQFKLPNTVLDMDLHPDGQRVVTAHHDRQLRISQLGE